MATTYTECPPDIKRRAMDIARQHHQHLLEGDVTIFFKWAENPDDVALMNGGYPAAATIKINSYEKRVEGMADATMTIDKEAWEELSEESQIALLDHELQHIDVRRNKAGAIKYDDANRPCLRLRKHDFQIGGFHSVAKRHGVDALEVQHVEKVNTVWKQMELFAAA
jgi:hypothetical protein